jgi:hypothetical protein
MDAFDFDKPPSRPARPSASTGMIWNMATATVFLLTLFMGGYFFKIFTDPFSGLNPFPPPVRATARISPTPTETLIPLLPPTWTPTATSIATETPTPRPSSTPLITETPFEFPTTTPEPEVDPNGMAFVIDQGSPKAMPNIFRQERGCSWLGVGGIVLDLSGSPIRTGILVELGGRLGGKPIQMLTITTPNALSSRLDYEFEISDTAVNSKGTLWIQLLDQANLPLSEKIYFDTFEDCDKNQIVLNFKQVR